ncbi:MAG: response regulator [Thiotrichaceae bacterium]
MSEPITVFIVDDEEAVRDSLKMLIESVGLVAETYDSAQSYLQAFDPSRHGCLILDVRMRGMSGLSLQEHLNKKPLHPPIIIITGHGDVQMAVRAVKAGASEFLEKPFNEQQLLDSIHIAIEQDAEQRGKASELAKIQARVDKLTEREKEVMELITTGMLNKNIAYELHISQSTVEAHRSKVMDKMEAKTLSDLMRMILSLKGAAS